MRSALVIALLTLALTLPFRWIDPPTSSIILQRMILTLSNDDSAMPRYEWIQDEAISPYLALSVITAEDQKFPEHFGFDFQSILDAATEERTRPRGASTISQQVAKNLYLWPGRSLVRKGIEAYVTLVIEALWPKRRILEVYLNIAEFGPNVFGASAASRYHFAKHPSQLSEHECALLAAVLPNPSKLSASQPSAYVQQRAASIAPAARALGGLDYLTRI